MAISTLSLGDAGCIVGCDVPPMRAADGWVYISSSQVNRRAEYNGGHDMQKPPYAILRTRIGDS